MIIVQDIKKPAYKIEPTIPYLDEIEENDFALVLVLFSQLIYPLIFSSYSIIYVETLPNTFIVIAFFCYGIYSLRFISSTYNNHKLKENILKDLITKIRDETLGYNRNFYLNIYLDIKNGSILKAGIIPKIIIGK